MSAEVEWIECLKELYENNEDLDRYGISIVADII